VPDQDTDTREQAQELTVEEQLRAAREEADEAMAVATLESFHLWREGFKGTPCLFDAYLAGIACIGRCAQYEDELAKGFAEGLEIRRRILGDEARS
jgi:hypothetical protein